MKINTAFNDKELVKLPFYYKYFIRYSLDENNQKQRDNQREISEAKSLNKAVSRLY